jgi:hypothetical protein
MSALCAALPLSAAQGLAQEPLPVEPQTQTAAESAAPVVLATVHGVVRNAATGQPLPRALVRIEGNADTGALTDGEGRFEIPGVPVGPQTIQVRKPGFHDRPYASEDVDYQSDGPAHNVLVAAALPELNFALTPASAIHGRIELSTGDPAQGITLTLLKQAVRNGRAVWAQNGTTRTNGEGAYRFSGLPSGTYALVTLPTFESEPAVTAVAAGRSASVARQGYPSIFYPQAREFADATRIRLRAGQQAEANLLLPLEPFYTVTATAILPNGRPYGGEGTEGSSSPGSGPAAVLDARERLLPYPVQFDPVTHSFQASLPDGVYSLFVGVAQEDAKPSGQIGTVFRNHQKTSLLSGFAELSVYGHAVANLRIPLSPLPSWPIQLRAFRTATQINVDANKELQNLVTVALDHAGEAPMDGSASDGQAEVAGPDLLEMSGLALGPHWISTQVNDRGLCVDSFTAGGINPAREPLNVALGSSPPPMELTLRDDCAKLTLELPPQLSAFLPGDEPFYTVYVVPDFDTTADIPPMNMHPSSGATLTVDGLTPGSYHVYTFDRPVRLEYRNLAVLAALPTPGQAVTLSAGTTSSLMLEVPGR